MWPASLCINNSSRGQAAQTTDKKKAMKKVLLLLAVIIMSASSAFAQRMALGVNIGAAPVIEDNSSVTNFILGAKFQYKATSLIRLEAAADFGFRDKGFSTFNLMGNVHFMIPCARNVYIYPLAGIGYGNIKFRWDDDDSESWDKFAFNVGIGAEYEVTSNFAANFEFKYQYMQDYGRLPILVGLTYKF